MPSTSFFVASLVPLVALLYLQWSKGFFSDLISGQNAVLLPRSKTPIVMAAVPAFRSVTFDLLSLHSY